jgi:hypothetical protein
MRTQSDLKCASRAFFFDLFMVRQHLYERG